MSLRRQNGYAMVALLVGLSIMSVALTVLMPAWKQAARREKEAELIFRGEQYKRAIELFQRRTGPGRLPPNLDVLVEGRFLRKQYRDPITGGQFLLIRQGQPDPSGAQGGTAVGAIAGVVSASREQSIALYEGRNFYNEWVFLFSAPANRNPGPTAGQPPRETPDGPRPSPPPSPRPQPD